MQITRNLQTGFGKASYKYLKKDNVHKSQGRRELSELVIAIVDHQDAKRVLLQRSPNHKGFVVARAQTARNVTLAAIMVSESLHKLQTCGSNNITRSDTYSVAYNSLNHKESHINRCELRRKVGKCIGMN